MDHNQWTMNCVLFGAEIFKKLSQGQITKEQASVEIKNLSSELDDIHVGYLLGRLDDLVK